jgi:hypothetical protein
MNDEFIDEINTIRRRMMEECGHDLKKLGELIKRSQEEDPVNMVAEVATTELQPAAKVER